ncbi:MULTISPECIES: hypothetical protein [unclassified Methanoregula]|uniref:hypothetical protein n=1 Tax=unclassified Methanoregula TaxID=2649730 RepID=UPI0009D35FFE|nr:MULTISPECIES: hypothetical protein [unclassified Methanoregula]OPX64738.1 MAG: hypothetical protein A4E33_00708 [Methanoregula sp. PtaB.Bin085]OPY35208.1 MAG: hypothetical protein A4E34_00885 [Methanoregula sp. PtaU1.Bin006]
MSRSPIFLFLVLLLLLVAGTAIVAGLLSNPPNAEAYLNESSTFNQSQNYISPMIQQAPNYMIPAVLITLALALIAVLWMVGRKTR